MAKHVKQGHALSPSEYFERHPLDLRTSEQLVAQAQAQSVARRKRAARINTLWRMVALLAVMAGLLVVASASSARAAAPAIDVPGVEVCPKEAPFANTPETGVAGLLGERPLKITEDDSPEHIWSTGGFAGLKSYTYDLGCAVNPATWAKVTNAKAGSSFTNIMLSIGDAVASLADTLDRRAWSPGWVLSFLDDFAQRATGQAMILLLLPYLGVSLALATALMLWRSRQGDYNANAHGIGWIMVVLTISAGIIATPMLVSSLGAKAGGTVAATVNGGETASDAITNQLVMNVQYQGWLRRTFGNSESAVAKEYGPQLLASTRISWKELDSINALPADEQGDAREKMSKAKAEKFKDVAAKIEDADPIAYRHLTGEQQVGPVETIIEMVFVILACVMRVMLSVLMIACVISLTVISCIWVVATLALLLPPFRKWSGQRTGMALINSGVRSLLYVAEAIIGVWLYGLFLQACIAPGMNLAWSSLFLLLGTIIAWLAIAPIAKLKAILSLGRADKASFMAKAMKSLVMTGGAGAGAALIGAWKVNKDSEERAAAAPAPAAVLPPQVVHAKIFHPAAPFVPERPTHVDGEPLPAAAGPAPLPAYERGARTDTPPPDAASSPYRPYERSDDTEGANR